MLIIIDLLTLIYHKQNLSLTLKPRSRKGPFRLVAP